MKICWHDTQIRTEPNPADFGEQGSVSNCYYDCWSIVEALHADVFCDRCRRRLPASRFSYSGLNVGFDNFCLDCETRGGPRLRFTLPVVRDSTVSDSFESSLFHPNIRDLVFNTASVERLHHLAIQFTNGTSQPQHLLDQLDLVISEIPVALLYAVQKVCERLYKQPTFASLEAPLKLRCDGMQSFGILFFIHVIHCWLLL